MSLDPPSASTAKAVRPPRTPDDPDTAHSKTLSYILRHGATKEFLLLRPDGFVRVSDLMKRPKLKHCSLETLKRIVQNNEKQRFTIQTESTGLNGEEELWIRANQGHSIPVKALELTLVKEEVGLQVIHGTYLKSWPLIAKEGLSIMSRNHIHCAVGLFGQEGVISGMRANAEVYVYLDVPKLFLDKIPLYRSSNDVILLTGLEGILPPRYFLKVVTRSGEVLL